MLEKEINDLKNSLIIDTYKLEEKIETFRNSVKKTIRGQTLLPLNQNSQKHGPKLIGLCCPCQKVVPLYICYLQTLTVKLHEHLYKYKTQLITFVPHK